MNYAATFHQRYAACPMSGCWLWLGAVGSHGYGAMGAGRDVKLAHRFSWELHYGAIPGGMYVCHICDNRICCNPRHLFLGTPSDNNRDAAAKGRTPRGGAHWNTKIHSADLEAIKQSGEMQAVLAARYGVDQSTISLIKSGKRRHVRIS